jgi:hypothetical protein
LIILIIFGEEYMLWSSRYAVFSDLPSLISLPSKYSPQQPVQVRP